MSLKHFELGRNRSVRDRYWRLAAFIFLNFLMLLESSSAAEMQAGDLSSPRSIVIVVIDGLGSAYVYPEHSAYALDGTILEKAILFNLTGSGARVQDLRARVPETGKSHSILVTGSLGAEPGLLGPTIFDAARQDGYLCLALLQRGDSLGVLLEQDLVLYFDDNSLHAEPALGFRAGAPGDLMRLMEQWRDVLPEHVLGKGAAAYSGYGCWEIDAAADLVTELGKRKFLMLVNVGSVDSAGHYLGKEGYLEVIRSLDAPLGRLAQVCQEKDAILMIISDHGMGFPVSEGKGGHASDKYAERLESLRIPLVVLGPDVEDITLGGIWFQEDVAPTILNLMEVSQNISSDGSALPLSGSYSLRIVGAPDEVEIYKNDDLFGRAPAAPEQLFSGLVRGIYSVKSGTLEQEICINGDAFLDLATKEKPSGDMKKIIGTILILAINLIGILLIIRIIKREEA